MPSTVLTATTGRTTGSPASRRLRGEGKVPGIVYGHGMAPMSVTVDRRELRTAVSGPAGMNTVLDLTVDDGAVYPAIIKDIQRHPVRRNVTHIDFIQVNLDEEITVHVPLHLAGEAVAVAQGGGLVDPAVDHIEVITTPRNIPDEFVIDVSRMTMDSIIRLADVPMPDGVTATGDPESAVVTVLTMRAELAEIEAADAEAAEEQAESDESAEGADGDAEGASDSTEGESDAADSAE